MKEIFLSRVFVLRLDQRAKKDLKELAKTLRRSRARSENQVGRLKKKRGRNLKQKTKKSTEEKNIHLHLMIESVSNDLFDIAKTITPNVISVAGAISLETALLVLTVLLVLVIARACIAGLYAIQLAPRK